MFLQFKGKEKTISPSKRLNINYQFVWGPTVVENVKGIFHFYQLFLYYIAENRYIP